MSIEHDIRQAKTPLDALVILARAIDAINARLDAEPADPWAEWSSPIGQTHTERVEHKVATDDEYAREHDSLLLEQQVAATKLQLSKATDPEEVEALSAKLRLLQDTGKPLTSVVDEGRRTTILADGSQSEIVLPYVDRGRRVVREHWAEQVRLWEYVPLDQEAATKSFALGGPMWLYLANRDAVMQLPFAARQWLVEDVALDSQAEAQELGRDILKSEESADKSITLAAIDAISESRG